MSELSMMRPDLTAAEFLRTDQRAFGGAWRYELVDGLIVAQDAPTPRHAQMHGHPCRVEVGSGAAPIDQQRATARIPDLLIGCEGRPRVVLEVISSSEMRNRRQLDRKRADEQGVDGVIEVVEPFQDQPALHTYRRSGSEWLFEAVGGIDAVLRIQSLGLAIPLGEIYEDVDFEE